MDYEKKYKDLIARLQKAKENDDVCDERYCCVIDEIAPELKESEDELTWLTKYIEEEAYSLSMDIRDNEDRIKYEKLQKALAWLEKQGEQKSQRTISAEAKEALYDKPAWSEEDAFRASALTDVVKSGGSIRPELRNEFVDWLKSIKERVQPIHEYSDTEKQEMFLRSQRPHFWKPSDEQMKALKYVAYHLMPDNNYREEMFSLYEDLKKLK